MINPENPIEVAEALSVRGLRMPGPNIGLLRPKPPEVSKGGIIIVEQSKKAVKFAYVIMIGQEVTRDIRMLEGVPLGTYPPQVFEIEVSGTTVNVEVVHEEDVQLVHPTPESFEWDDREMDKLLDEELGSDCNDKGSVE